MTPRADGYIAVSTDVHGHIPTTESLTIHGGTIKTAPHGGSFTVSPDSQSYTYAYGPKGLAGLLHNHFTFGCAAFASIGGLTFGYDQGVIANVLVMKDFTERWPVGPWEIGLMTAILELGALVGALLAGILADRYSRRHSIFLACVIFCVGSGFQCGARKLSDLFFGRAIGGIGIGSLSMLAPLYMAEISSPEVRGSLMALEQFAIVLGVVFGFWAGFFTRSIPGSLSWRIPLAVQLGPGILLGFGCLLLPPSPRLLILQGKDDQALHSLARLRLRDPSEEHSDPLLQLEFLEMQVEAKLLQRSGSIGRSNENGFIAGFRSWTSLFSPKYIDRTMIGVVIMFFQQWSGINGLLYYGPSLMFQLGLTGDTVKLLGSGGIGIVQLLAVIPAILYIDRIGRKPLLEGGGIVMGFSHLCIALLVWIYHDLWGSHHFAAWVAVGFVYLFTAAYGISYGPVAWILPSEVLPLSVRSKGVALSTASNWINNFFVALLVPRLLVASPTATLLIFSTACFGASLWAWMIVPETANVSLEEMDSLFKSDVAHEDAERKREITREVGLETLLRELTAVEGEG